MCTLKPETSRTLPFDSLYEEALLNLMRTADCLQRVFQQHLRRWGLTSTQYNVLRILRGAQPEGLTCSAIGSRMITAEPDITLLLARLKISGLIEQNRDPIDRRILWTRIASSGLSLLAEMDPLLARLPEELLGHLPPDQVSLFSRLLQEARAPHAGPSDKAACDGPGPCAKGAR